ncbi:MAG: VPLPA-CTERM sorting domain-containing protein [Phycisphaerales bacterium JB040]
MKTAAIIAVAGLASVATAQSATVFLQHDDADSTINVGETVTWTLSVAFTGGEVVSGVNMAINGDNTLGTSSGMAYTATNGGNNGGTSNGAGIGFVNLTNSLFIEAFQGILALRDNPLVIGTFDFTAGAEGTLNYTIAKGQSSSAFVSVAQSAFAETLFANPGDVAIEIQSLTIVPTPASAALLGLGGLVATRRRR